MGPRQWVMLGEVLREFLQLDRNEQTVDCWNRYVQFQDDLPTALVAKGNPDGPAGEALVETFARSVQVRRVAEALGGGRVVGYAHLAQQVFDTYDLEPQEAQNALSVVIQCGMVARRGQGDFPLLPADTTWL